MKALVYHGPGQRGWDTVDDPTIVDPTDVDRPHRHLHDLRHRPAHPQRRRARDDARDRPRPRGRRHRRRRSAPASARSRPATACCMSCVSSCGRCRFCKEGRYGQCLGGGGWIFGHLIDGLQAEYARVPFADNSVYKLPDELSDEQVLFLADILPTSFEVGVLNGMVSPGDMVAIVGAGPIGLAAILDGAALHARPDRGDRPRRQPAREREALRRRRHDQQRSR